jgi:hypothetical protein
MENRYEMACYSDLDINILAATTLTDAEMQIVADLKAAQKDKAYSIVIEDLYKFNKNNYSTSDLAEIYKVSTRQIQKIFKELGINRSKVHAQTVYVINKDAEKLSRTYKNILFEKLIEYELSEASLEVQIRHQLDILLKGALPTCEIIIGISSMEFSRENINVPVIIIDNSFLYKYIIEIIKDGTNRKSSAKKKEQNRLSRTFYKGYTLFKLDILHYYNSKEEAALKFEKEIKNKLLDILQNITTEVKVGTSVTKLQ